MKKLNRRTRKTGVIKLFVCVLPAQLNTPLSVSVIVTTLTHIIPLYVRNLGRRLTKSPPPQEQKGTEIANTKRCHSPCDSCRSSRPLVDSKIPKTSATNTNKTRFANIHRYCPVGVPQSTRPKDDDEDESVA